MKKYIYIFLIAGLHFIASVSTQLLEIDTMGPFGLFPEKGYGLATGISHVLAFPVIYLFDKFGTFSNQLLLPFAILNSLVWGLAIYLVVTFACRHMRPKAR